MKSVKSSTFWKSIFIVISFFLISFYHSSSKADGVPHLIYGKVLNSSGDVPGKDDIEAYGYVHVRPEEMLDKATVGCGYDLLSGDGWLWFEAGNYFTPWSINEVLRIIATDQLLGETGFVDITLDSGGKQLFPDLVLMPGDHVGPIASNVKTVEKIPGFIPGGKASIAVAGKLDDLLCGKSNIQKAEFFIDTDPGMGSGTSMNPQDGSFDSPQEEVLAFVDTTSWTVRSTHTIYVRGQDTAGNWGTAQGVTFSVVPIYPMEGTIGTEITITGSTFGSKRGKVLIGITSLKVIKWTNESIHCLLTKALVPGTYDVTIKPVGKGVLPIVEKNGFTVEAPEIYSIEQGSGTSSDQVTIKGKFFGTKKGKVYLEYEENGELVRKGCKVLSWTMDPINGESQAVFVVPVMPPAVCDVVVDPIGILPEAEEEEGFTIEAPEITLIEPSASGSAGDQITIHGKLFGIKKGKVYLEYLVKGVLKRKSCKVVSWTMNPITDIGQILFEVPRGLAAGTYDLKVVNSVGSDTWKGFIIVD